MNRDAFYNKHLRNPQSKAFYNSAAWRGPSGARTQYIREHPICERCQRVTADHIHHKTPIDTPEGWERRLDPSGFMSVCRSCHNRIEAETPKPVAPIIAGQLQPNETDQYRYDPDRASALSRFAAKYCNHFRGKLRGQPFILHQLQESFINPFLGFIDRETGFRRYSALWLEQGVGTGKTPLLSIFGLWGLLGAGEAGAQIYIASNTYHQADYAFSTAKTFIKNNQHLSRLVDSGKLKVNRFEITYTPTDSVWRIIGGDGSKAGAGASMLLLDEVHQIDKRGTYDDIQGRMTKRDQPIVVCATNAAKKPNSLYADLHEEAADTLTAGRRFNPHLFPVIWAATKDADPADPESWKAANKLIGVTIAEQAVRDEWNRSKGSPALEARFRLQYLGQQVSEAEKWIDQTAWKKCCQTFTPNQIEGQPHYVGLDASIRNDLCAVVHCHLADETLFATSQFWLPKATAAKYQESNEIPYSEWADANAINLLEEKTINTVVEQRIASAIIDSHKTNPITKVAYDQAYAGGIVEILKSAGIVCEKVPQGWTLSAGCNELDKRLIEQSIMIEPSPVMNFCAENVEITTDKHGNYWPVKPGAKSSKSTGKRWAKIDGIQALVTALTEARKHQFAKTGHVGAEAFSLD
jgi:phage terminase large subunit-like protein